MKRLCYMFAALAAVAFASQAMAQIANGGFELPTTTDNANGNWQRFSGGGISADSTAMPHSGSGNLSLELLGTNGFAGAFQRLAIGVGPGAQVTFSGWHKQVAGVTESEIKLEWQGMPNPPQNVLFTRALTSDYTQFNHVGVAPAGTTGLVVTYAIASFAAGTGAGEVYVDDISVSIIPEPATAGLLGLGLVALSCVRRRK